MARASEFRICCPEADNSTDGARGGAPRFGPIKMLSAGIQADAAGNRGSFHDSQFAPQPDEVLAIAAECFANVAVGRALQPSVEQSAHCFQHLVQLQERKSLFLGARNGRSRKALEEAAKTCVCPPQ